jgi:hypothetical protein
VVILPEERGYIAGRAWLYFCTENSSLPKLLRWSHALRSDQLPKIVVYLAPGSAHAGPSAQSPIKKFQCRVTFKIFK